MGYIFTFVSTRGLLPVGSVMELKANTSDKNGVDGYIGEEIAGFIASDPALITRNTNASAAAIRKSVLDHPKCKAAYGLVLQYERKAGKAALFSVELFVVPVREEKQDQLEPIRYQAKGLASANPKKAELMGRVQKLINNGEPVNIPVSILRERIGTEERFLVCPESVTAGASAGTISDADDVLETLIPISEAISATRSIYVPGYGTAKDAVQNPISVIVYHQLQILHSFSSIYAPIFWTIFSLLM